MPPGASPPASALLVPARARAATWLCPTSTSGAVVAREATRAPHPRSARTPRRVARARVEELGAWRGTRCGSSDSRNARASGPSTPRVQRAAARRVAVKSSRSSPPSTPRSWLPTRQTSARSRDQRAALVRLRPVADEVAEAPERVGASRRPPRATAVERVAVRVDVGDDCDAHRARPRWRGLFCVAVGGRRDPSLAHVACRPRSDSAASTCTASSPPAAARAGARLRQRRAGCSGSRGTLATLVALVVLAWRLPRSAARHRARADRQRRDRRHGRARRRSSRRGCRSRSPAQWWQHRYGLAPLDSARVARRAVGARSRRGGLRAVAIVARWWRSPSGFGRALVARRRAAVRRARGRCFVFVSGWLRRRGHDRLRTRLTRRRRARSSGARTSSVPVRRLDVSDWTHQANAFAAGPRPVDARRRLGHAARRPLLARRGRRRRRARARPRRAAGTSRRARLARAARLPARVPRRRGDAPARRARQPRDPSARVPRPDRGRARRRPPFENAVSRRYEAEADWRALQATHDPAATTALFAHFEQTSLEEPNPPRWAYVLLENHPTLAQRIAMAERSARPLRVWPGGVSGRSLMPFTV